MPADVTPELRAYLLEQIDRCRRAFESGENYAALLEALNLCHQADTCPAWIVSAMQTIITSEIADSGGAVGRWYKQYRQDLVDFARAEFMDDAKRHGFTWAEAAEFAAEYFGPTSAGHAGPDAMLKSHGRVRNASEDAPGRFYVTDDAARRVEDFRPPSQHASEVFRKHIERVKRAGRYIEDP